ncbi:hypothetical protein [Mycobacterium pseudokansasii]|uniref:hypothetical protein n=1 Tax=Mycobacterium pseudokansasii TaxID=2341080 RepID=UPI0010A94F20|nr:hypothetical protein [Mycobacterium pseudokansasii]
MARDSDNRVDRCQTGMLLDEVDNLANDLQSHVPLHLGIGFVPVLTAMHEVSEIGVPPKHVVNDLVVPVKRDREVNRRPTRDYDDPV